MIGAFARMLRSRDRVLSYEEAPEGHKVNGLTGADGAPPAAFVEKHSEDGGDVYVAPMVEALRDVLRRRRKEAAAPPETTLPRLSDSP